MSVDSDGETGKDGSLWAAARMGEAAAVAALFARHERLIPHVLRRLAPPRADWDDLYQVGAMGLVKAVRRFDPARGTAFATYAVPLILGEVRRWLRDNQAIHLPRRLQERGSLLAAAADRWAQQHGREPTVRDLADALGWDVATVVETMDSRRPPLSWEGAEPDEDMSWGERVGTAPAEGEWVSRIVVEDMLRALGPRGHALVFRRFVLGESQAAVAARLGLSQAQVSRLERRTLLRLRQLWTLATTDAAPHQRADHRTH